MNSEQGANLSLLILSARGRICERRHKAGIQRERWLEYIAGCLHKDAASRHRLNLFAVHSKRPAPAEPWSSAPVRLLAGSAEPARASRRGADRSAEAAARHLFSRIWSRLRRNYHAGALRGLAVAPWKDWVFGSGAQRKNRPEDHRSRLGQLYRVEQARHFVRKGVEHTTLRLPIPRRSR